MERYALKEFNMQPGEGIITDMRAVRKDYFLDHDHSSYVDQWDWEKSHDGKERNLEYQQKQLKDMDCSESFRKIHTGSFSEIKNRQVSDLPDELTFLPAEEILDMYPDLPRKGKQRYYRNIPECLFTESDGL